MVRVIVPPICTVVAGVNTRTGATVAPETCDARVMEAKVSPVIAGASTPADNVVSTLDDIWKPAVTVSRTAPSLSPVRVMVIAEVPDAAPAVVRTMVVLVDVAAGVDVAAKDVTLLVMEATVPKK